MALHPLSWGPEGTRLIVFLILKWNSEQGRKHSQRIPRTRNQWQPSTCSTFDHFPRNIPLCCASQNSQKVAPDVNLDAILGISLWLWDSCTQVSKLIFWWDSKTFSNRGRAKEHNLRCGKRSDIENALETDKSPKVNPSANDLIPRPADWPKFEQTTILNFEKFIKSMRFTKSNAVPCVEIKEWIQTRV